MTQELPSGRGDLVSGVWDVLVEQINVTPETLHESVDADWVKLAGAWRCPGIPSETQRPQRWEQHTPHSWLKFCVKHRLTTSWTLVKPKMLQRRE